MSPKIVYQSESSTLYHGDCLDVIAGLKVNSIDAVVTDPPYGIVKGAAFVRKGTRIVDNGDGKFNNNHSWAWLNNPKWLIDGGNVAVFWRAGDRFPQHVQRWNTFYLVKTAPPPTPRPLFVSAVEECGIGRKPGKSRWFGDGYTINYWQGMTPNRSNKSSGHPTEKPLAAIETLVRVLSREGETVLDPFTGSGTTGIACARYGRKFIGVELDAGYCDIAARRIEAAEKRVRQILAS